MNLISMMKKWWLAVPGLLIVGLLSLRFVGTKTEASSVTQRLELDSLREVRTQSKHYDIAQRIDALYRDLNKRRGYNCAPNAV